MTKTELNISELNQYLSTFGYEKFCFLWREYLESSSQSWANMDNLDLSEKKYIFHNWRAGSKIFGMDSFSLLCQKTEECIINCRTAKIEKLISDCKKSYDEQAELVKIYISQIKEDHEK
ncbi:MAG: hypothetical protein E7012_00070 [Alphaproteobacteria bacterium]|nr:hypothetical protein [Alphaproteobacteria bacterium]